MAFKEPTVKSFMTLQPQTIEVKDTIESAKRLMARFKIRHLPVMNDGILVGMLSEREVNLANGIDSLDPSHLLVADIYSDRPYVVSPVTPLREVVGIMAKKSLGSAIVMENAKLVGILTTVDVCRALHDIIEEVVEDSNLECARHFKFFLKA